MNIAVKESSEPRSNVLFPLQGQAPYHHWHPSWKARGPPLPPKKEPGSTSGEFPDLQEQKETLCKSPTACPLCVLRQVPAWFRGEFKALAPRWESDTRNCRQGEVKTQPGSGREGAFLADGQAKRKRKRDGGREGRRGRFVGNVFFFPSLPLSAPSFGSKKQTWLLIPSKRLSASKVG